jgi:hypothetical protein
MQFTGTEDTENYRGRENVSSVIAFCCHYFLAIITIYQTSADNTERVNAYKTYEYIGNSCSFVKVNLCRSSYNWYRDDIH